MKWTDLQSNPHGVAGIHAAGEQEIKSSGDLTFMTRKNEFQHLRTLAETHTEGFEVFLPEQVAPGRGCLLQIFPARANSEIVRLNGSRTMIGRDASCDVTLEDNAVSRNHAVINSDNDGYFLADLSSTNGTYVDDRRIFDDVQLLGGELIRFGGTVLKFMSAVDEEAQYHAVVHEVMSRDPLTQAFNRSYLVPTLEKVLLSSQRLRADISVLMMDIDFFKQVNDSHGHLVGDEVLKVFCERVGSYLRQTDILARWGGEEFVVLARQTRLAEARRVAERIRLAISSLPFPTKAGNLRITCSIGVAWTDGSTPITVDQLIGVADHWLYVAKESGRNNVKSQSEFDTAFSL